MLLYLIRHAEAVRAGPDGMSDEERPLTEAGRSQSRALAPALKKLGVKIDRVLSSPLVRARQTAEEMLAAWGEGAPPQGECMLLAPGNKERKLMRALHKYPGETLALVGHNPDLSELCGWLMGDRRIGLDMAKAAVACLEFETRPAKGAGTLVWLVTPAWCAAVGGSEELTAETQKTQRKRKE